MIPHHLLSILLGLGIVACASAVPITEQQVLSDPNNPEDKTEFSRHLSGRFLHITDFHLDLHYKRRTSVDQVCHRGKGSAGPLGAEGSNCDTPLSLVDETFRWIERNLKNKIDFVLWTGDSARHDNDEKIPRTADEIIDLNEVLASKFIGIFKDGDSSRGLSIPIIPTIGNNDIMPHNIFTEGPNKWTRRFTEVWAKFIPEHQRHTFEEGGWFSAEVIPNKLAVISLNTMYFYESNSAVDGCASKLEPGFEHMEWLRVQLELLREREMKAILIGHVPPARAGAKRSWDESCWQKYALFLNRFRDVIVGSVYGHMNIDHFMLQDSREVDIIAADEDSSGDFVVQSRSSYLSSLREDWADMPSPPDDMPLDSYSSNKWGEADASSVALGKKERRFLEKIGGPWAERYSVSLVSPSVVPNYFPTLRVVEYNITGIEGVRAWADTPYSDTSFESSVWDATNSRSDESGKQKRKKKKKKKKPQFKIPEHPSPTAPPGPAYSNQALTWLSYAQYYANLSEIYDQMEGSSNALSPHTVERKEDAGDHLDLYKLEYDTKDDGVYKTKDLTVRSYFKLAKRIANRDSNKKDTLTSELNGSVIGGDKSSDITKKTKKRHRNWVWRTFLARAFVGFLTDDELDDILE